LMLLLKERKMLISKKSDDEDKKLKSHILSMKRTQVFKGDELMYAWQKTDGNDHFFLAMLYLYVACLLRGTVAPTNTGSVPLVTSFAVRR
jgi:hypothetical protein